VQELGDLPDGLNEMPSIKKVQDWYAQSFEVNKSSCVRVRLGILTCDKGNNTATKTKSIERRPRATHEALETKWQIFENPDRKHSKTEVGKKMAMEMEAIRRKEQHEDTLRPWKIAKTGRQNYMTTILDSRIR
jgi:hypothetical protein